MYIKPKNIKYLKVQKGVLKIRDFSRTTKKNSIPVVNSFSFFSKVSGFFIDKHLETGKKILKSILSHNNIYVLKVFPHKPITKKALGVRIGKGKGAVSGWVVPVTVGSIIFEIRNVSFSKAFQAFQKIKKKIPLSIGFRERKQPLYLAIISFNVFC